MVLSRPPQPDSINTKPLNWLMSLWLIIIYTRGLDFSPFFVNLLISLLLSSQLRSIKPNGVSQHSRSSPVPAGRYNRNVNEQNTTLPVSSELLSKKCWNKIILLTHYDTETLRQPLLVFSKPKLLGGWLTQVMALTSWSPTWLQLQVAALSWVLALLQWRCDSSQARQICTYREGWDETGWFGGTIYINNIWQTSSPLLSTLIGILCCGFKVPVWKC